MALKKLNLDVYNSDTIKTQYKHNKYTTYIENEAEETIDEINDMRSKRINMAFSDENYEYLISQSNKIMVPIVVILNTVIPSADDTKIEKYLGTLSLTRSKDHVSRQKGHKVKRINVRFQADVYSKMVSGAEKFNMTITQYVNTVIESHRADTW